MKEYVLFADTIINRTLHNNFSGLFYGLAFTKPNPDFLSTVDNKFSKDCKLLLVCQEGLRSGAAADQLERAGFQNLAYISLGLQKVTPGIFDKEGPQELQDAGKGGLVTIQGKISMVLGTVLVGKFLSILKSPTFNVFCCIWLCANVSFWIVLFLYSFIEDLQNIQEQARSVQKEDGCPCKHPSDFWAIIFGVTFFSGNW
ncbi:hypothetical protein L7F22_006468 [Adiantum nelumboides]|nr:hypothetical protein [Adiantum nelumboides]